MSDAIPPALILVDREGRIAATTPARKGRVPRIPAGNEPAFWYERYVDDAEHGTAAVKFSEALRDGPQRFELGSRSQASSRRRVWWQMLRIADRDDVVGLMASAMTTDRDENASAAAREAESALFRHAPIGLAEITVEGHWLRANPKLCDMLGYAREALLRTNFWQVVADANLRVDADACKRLLNGPFERCSKELRCLRSDGTPLWVQIDIVAMSADEHRQRLLAVIADIEARKRSEAALQFARDRMETLSGTHVARQTVAAIAHELNQPLNALAAYAEAAQRMLAMQARDEGRLRRALDGCARQAQRAGATLQELMDFLGREQETPEPIDLNECVRTALAIAEDAGYGGFEAVLELDCALRKVMASRRQVEKVLVNLLRNAVEAMRHANVRESSITVIARTSGDGALAQVTVCDNGPGMDAPTLAKVFQPFFSTKEGGLGMGLTISRALIESNGGRLWADACTGAGACFHFTLPFA